ncbi:secretion/conjugation apparatus DotM-related subunit [Yersinia aldovae]|uniref:secretion/conjugation apparatus DotM-related subunit n=1 Tax=Yersinia aldovae TaxID=29483 RepID=UPI0011A38891|nr:conjugal transfer protein TrbA [Yersinia aldovae]
MKNNRSADNGLIAFSLLIIGLLLVWIVIWYSNHTKLAYYGLYSAWMLLAPFDLQVFPLIGELRREIAEKAANPSAVSFFELFRMMNIAGYAYIILPILLTCLSIRMALHHRMEKVRRVITAENLPHIMSVHSPAITPVLYYGDLMNEDIRGHESRIHPEEFAISHNLIDPVTKIFNEDKTKALFVKQLGRKISSLDELNIYERALFSIFAIRVFDSAEVAGQAQEMLDLLNRSCHTGHWKGMPGYPEFEILNKLSKKYIELPEAKALLGYYPYPSTFLHILHQKACMRGKLPSSHFRWLKAIDRKLWYTLNATGRRTPCIESIIQVQLCKWQTLAYQNGYMLKEPYFDDSIRAFKNYLIKEGLVSRICSSSMLNRSISTAKSH